MFSTKEGTGSVVAELEATFVYLTKGHSYRGYYCGLSIRLREFLSRQLSRKLFMTWNETDEAISRLKARLCLLPVKTKENTVEYEKLAKPIRAEAIQLHYTRIDLTIKKQYE